VLLSMTGFGEARFAGDHLSLSVEVRTVNNKFLKISVRGTEPYPMLEPELEKRVRKHVRRGSVTIHIRVDRRHSSTDFQLNVPALRTCIEQVHALCRDLGTPQLAAGILSSALLVPGITPAPGNVGGRPPDDEFHAVEDALESALKQLHGMRQEEGQAMADELLQLHQIIAGRLQDIRNLIPGSTQNFRQRLRDRVSQALAEHRVAVSEENLIREVAVFSERSDVSEEITRLASHLDQFEKIVRRENDSPGRKLEFVAQEMGREANTVGSKAGDVAISQHVIEIKSALEKVRELVQNIE
jgi:uncharacterized protein (TIGR00255 family)